MTAEQPRTARDRLFNEVDERFGRNVARFVDSRLDAIEAEAARPLPEPQPGERTKAHLPPRTPDEVVRWMLANDFVAVSRRAYESLSGALPDRPEPSLNVQRLAALMRDHCHDSADEGVPILLRHKHLAPFVRDDCAAAILKALSQPPVPATAHEETDE